MDASSRTIEDLGELTFAFAPALVGVPVNEWRYRESTWSEVLVATADGAVEVWIPRRLLAAVSPVDQPRTTVGLTRALEFKAGAVWPHHDQSSTVQSFTAPPELPRVAGPVPQDPSSPTVHPTDRAATRFLTVGLAIAAALTLATFLISRPPPITADPTTTRFRPIAQLQTGLTARDDYFAVVRKLGPPESDRSSDPSNPLQYRLLFYPNRVAVLMGENREKLAYVGLMTRQGTPLQTVPLPDGDDSAAFLRSLPLTK